jgi:hypothetical protein
MKKLLFLALLIAATTLPTTWAKPKPKSGGLADFKGAYSGTLSYFNNFGGFSGTGTTSIVVTSSKNGRSGTVILTGSVVISGTPLAISETLTYVGNTLIVSDFAPQIVPAMSITGPFQINKKATVFTSAIPWNYQNSTIGTDVINLVLTRNKRSQTLSIAFVLNTSDVPNYLQINWTATKKIKPPKK